MHAQITFPSTTHRERSTSYDEELLTFIHEGPLEQQPWLRLLKRLREYLNCRQASISFRHRTATEASFESVVACGSSMDTVLTSKRADLATSACLDPIPYQQLVPGQVYLGHELLVGDNASYREFLQSQGLDDLLILLIQERGGMRAWLTLARTATQPPFNTIERGFVRSLTQHLTMALHSFAVLNAAELERDLYRQVFEGIACGTLLIDQSGCVVRTDNAATKLLERTPALSIVDGRLCAANQSDDCELYDAIAAALRESSSESRQYSRALRLIECPCVTLLVRSLAPSASSSKQGAAAAVVYLSDTQAASTVSVQHLVDLFKLSDMEAALVLQLVQGRTLVQAAGVLNLSEQTARAYSKQIFAKSGMHRQVDLVRFVLTSVARLAV